MGQRYTPAQIRNVVILSLKNENVIKQCAAMCIIGCIDIHWFTISVSMKKHIINLIANSNQFPPQHRQHPEVEVTEDSKKVMHTDYS